LENKGNLTQEEVCLDFYLSYFLPTCDTLAVSMLELST